MTIVIDDCASKYETKRTGLSCDEALEATVLGYRVRSPSVAPNAYIHYVGNGWRIQFVTDGVEGSSSGWSPDRHNFIKDDWEIVPLASELKRDAWGFVIQGLPVDDPRNPNRDSWGRPINGIA